MSQEELDLDDINIKVADLLNSKHPEHHALAEKYRDVLQGLIDAIKPIARLMTTPHKLLWRTGGRDWGWVTVDCIELGMRRVYRDVFFHLLLTDEGNLLEISHFEYPDQATWEVRGVSDQIDLTKAGTNDSRHVWEEIPFGEIINNLSRALSEARSRRDCLQEDVEEKEQKLDRALAIFKGG